MNAQTNHRPYDLFKLVVALTLFIIFIVLLLRKPPTQVAQAVLPTPSLQPEATATAPAPTHTLIPSATAAATATVATASLPPFPGAAFKWFFNAADGTLVDPQGKAIFRLDSEAQLWLPVIPAELEATLPQGYTLNQVENGWVIRDADGATLYDWDAGSFTWIKAEPVAAPVDVATATPTPGDTPTPTATTAPLAPGETPTPTALPTPSESTVVCAGALPSRLHVGDTVRVTTSLNLRSEPGIGNNLVGANPTGAQLTIIGGPVCLAHQGSAYVWWQVQGQDGQTGWSAEASLTGSFYFLEPVP